MIFEGHDRRQSREHNERAWLAWHVASLTRAKAIPKLDRLQVRMPTPPQSWEQQREIARLWVLAMGGKVETLKKD